MNNIYLRAAELLEDPTPLKGRLTTGGFSCLAICCAEFLISGNYDTNNKHVSKYKELFAPEYPDYAWGKEWKEDKSSCRILALLFMHWISQSESQE